MARRLRQFQEIPALHLIMIVIPFIIILICLIIMPLYPKDEHLFLQTTITGCLTFIFGKLTNGFGKSLTAGVSDAEASVKPPGKQSAE